MVETAHPIPAARVELQPGFRQREALREDAWPHTTRFLPWALAGFVVMLWLVPFQDVRLPVTLPVDAKLDRFVLAGVALVWLAALFAGGPDAPRLRRSPVNVALAAFVTLAFVSVLLNVDALVNVGDFSLAFKKLALLVAYAMLFYVASTSLRAAEIGPFCTLTVVLASLTAIGTVWEYRMGANLFYDLTAKVLPPGFALFPETADPKFARPNITGPTQHGLAVTTMLSLALPFAAVGIVRARELWPRIGYIAATAIILAGTTATLRKTALIMPLAALLVLLLYRRRDMLRLAPLGVVLVFAIQVLSPGALASIRGQLDPSRLSGSDSTQGRTADYVAVAPDVKTHLATGRGYGTYDAHKYRLLDNQYLVTLIETGILGTAAYVGIVLAAFLASHALIRSGDPSRAPPALAAAAAAGAFFVCNALFDTLAYPQVAYLFLFVVALPVVAGAGRRPGDPEPARRPWLRAARPRILRSARN